MEKILVLAVILLRFLTISREMACDQILLLRSLQLIEEHRGTLRFTVVGIPYG